MAYLYSTAITGADACDLGTLALTSLGTVSGGVS
jgi:hypothetical protein